MCEELDTTYCYHSGRPCWIWRTRQCVAVRTQSWRRTSRFNHYMGNCAKCDLQQIVTGTHHLRYPNDVWTTEGTHETYYQRQLCTTSTFKFTMRTSSCFTQHGMLWYDWSILNIVSIGYFLIRNLDSSMQSSRCGQKCGNKCLRIASIIKSTCILNDCFRYREDPSKFFAKHLTNFEGIVWGCSIAYSQDFVDRGWINQFRFREHPYATNQIRSYPSHIARHLLSAITLYHHTTTTQSGFRDWRTVKSGMQSLY